MHRLTAVLFAVVLMATTAPASADSKPAAGASDSAKRAASRDGWPETRAGEVGRAWVRAFASGDSSMREFYRKELNPESLAKRSMDSRIENYRKLRERLGRLTLATVIKSTPGELTVSLMDADAAQHEFIFTVQTEPPHKLVSVSFKDKRASHGGFHH